ncbi:MAG: hypothetical protein HYV16_10030 [Gammaproteobacteria bacterium]|nr:hypothetical protein [Gammaproteobacteria bacterium]
MPNHFTLASRLLLAALLCLTSAPAFSQWYEVEVLVFEPTQADGKAETWPENVSLPSAGNAIDILAPSIVEELPVSDAPAAATPATLEQEQPYQALPAASLRLGEAKRRLEAAAYRPLAHLAWRQPITAAAQSVPLKIQGGTSYAQPVPPQPLGEIPATAETAPVDPAAALEAAPEAETSPAESAPPPLWELEGLLRLSAEPQIDFEADLVLRKLLPAAEIPVVVEAAAELDPATTAPAIPNYRLFAVKSKKRLKSEETHYLDHPLLGVLVQLRPYDPPTPDAPAPDTNGIGTTKSQ